MSAFIKRLLLPDPKRLWIRYLIAVVALVLFMTFHFLAMQEAAQLSDRYASVINKSGKQRMLSQRIALFAADYGGGESATARHDTQRLTAAVEQFAQSHDELTDPVDSERGIPLSPELVQLYYSPDPGNRLDQDVRRYIEAVRQLIRSPTDVTSLKAEIQNAARNELLPKLERAVLLYERDAVESIGNIRSIAKVGFILSLLVLLFEACLIFLPAHMAIKQSMERLNTQNRKLAESVRRLKVALRHLRATRAADVAKSDFLAHMSHEFRTPLNAITGFAEFIKTVGVRKLPVEKVEEYLDDILASGIHLRNMVSDVLDIARIENRNIDIQIAEHRSMDLLQDAVSITKKSAFNREITVDIRNCADVPLLCDRQSMVKCLVNVLQNAIKYSPQASTVFVIVRHHADTTEISVEDEGSGFPAEILANLGQPFLRASDPMVSSTEGTGLGLTITKRLMEVQKGSLIIENRATTGARVTLSLPNSNPAYWHKDQALQPERTLH